MQSYSTKRLRDLYILFLFEVKGLHQVIIFVNTATGKTIKLSYRKAGCAMHPMYGCSENFLESLAATFPEIFNGLLFRLSL